MKVNDKAIISEKVLNQIENIEEAIFPVFKPLGWSSFDVVRFLKGRFKIKKIGHGGTLDPLATGIILIFTGKNTKKISEYQKLKKTYVAKIVFGATTNTLDTEFFPINFVDSSKIDIDDIIDTIKTHFVGQITQIPPIFSALKHEGKPLYKIARNDREISEIEIAKIMEKKKRIVNVFDFEVINYKTIGVDELPFNSHLLTKDKEAIKKENEELVKKNFEIHRNIKLLEIECKIECQSGTYIRSIARDLAFELGFEGYLTYLERVEEYGFKIADL